MANDRLQFELPMKPLYFDTIAFQNLLQDIIELGVSRHLAIEYINNLHIHSYMGLGTNSRQRLAVQISGEITTR